MRNQTKRGKSHDFSSDIIMYSFSVLIILSIIMVLFEKI